MPQQISDRRDIRPGRRWVVAFEIVRNSPTRLGNDLDIALDELFEPAVAFDVADGLSPVSSSIHLMDVRISSKWILVLLAGITKP